jgi:hypothetical protein
MIGPCTEKRFCIGDLKAGQRRCPECQVAYNCGHKICTQLSGIHYADWKRFEDFGLLHADLIMEIRHLDRTRKYEVGWNNRKVTALRNGRTWNHIEYDGAALDKMECLVRDEIVTSLENGWKVGKNQSNSAHKLIPGIEDRPYRKPRLHQPPKESLRWFYVLFAVLLIIACFDWTNGGDLYFALTGTFILLLG